MKKRYVIEIEVDETGGEFVTCEGCLELVFNDTPNTREIKPIKVLAIKTRANEPLTSGDIRDLIIDRGLTVRKVIDAASSLNEFVLVGLKDFDRNIRVDAVRRKDL